MNKTGKAWEVLYHQMQMDIILGTYRPRERLIEDEIIARHGVTRHAVRRALDELERIGLVARQPNKGVHVRDYSIAEIDELYEIRECLEMRAARRYELPVPDGVISELTEIAQNHKTASREQQFSEVFALNNAFHELLYRSAGNQQLADAIVHYTFVTHPIRARAFPDEDLREVAIAEHFTMIEALKAGELERLAQLIKTHISRPKDFYKRASSLGEFSLSD